MPHTRSVALAAGPCAVTALVLFLTAVAVHGDDVVAVTRGPLGVASNALSLLSLLLVLAGLARLAGRPALADPAGARAALAAAAGTVLVAGGAWAQLVVLPVLAVEAPQLAESGATLLTAAYVGSFLAMGAGWLLVARRLARGGVPWRLVAAGAVLMVAPLPARWSLLAVAVTLLVRDETAAVEPARPVASLVP